jgi:hypothetical protein
LNRFVVRPFYGETPASLKVECAVACVGGYPALLNEALGHFFFISWGNFFGIPWGNFFCISWGNLFVRWSRGATGD